MTTISEEIPVGSITAIPVGEGRTIEVAGERVAIFNARDGQVHAVQATCPHRGGPLADGLFGETTVVCPLHGWKFNVSTGECVGPPTAPCKLRTYSVRLNEAGKILLTVPSRV